jgi:hypothetical protein
MDERPVVWDASNQKHLGEDHPERRISVTEIEEVLMDPGRIEVFLEKRGSYECVGQTQAGRWLVIAWIDDPAGRYPVHARAAGRRLIRKLAE